jgi:hypothetical protein
LFGKELLKQGLRWGIGDGQKTKMMTDCWVPGIHPFQMKTRVAIPDGATVDFFMDLESGGWDPIVVSSIFEEEVASQILQIPVSRHGGEDFASWPHSKTGEYTVRSGYNLARMNEFIQSRSTTGCGLGSDMSEEIKCWKKLWRIKAPGKMVITLWRFIHDCLPTAHQLCHRHIPCTDACVFCCQEERVEHVFLFCQYAREVWRELKKDYSVRLERKGFTSPKDWVFGFLGRAREIDLILLAVTVWHLWDARNAVRNGESLKNPNSLAGRIKAYVEMIELHVLEPSSKHSHASICLP